MTIYPLHAMNSPGHTDPESGPRKKQYSTLPILLVSILLCVTLVSAWWYFAPRDNSDAQRPTAAEETVTPEAERAAPESNPPRQTVSTQKAVMEPAVKSVENAQVVKPSADEGTILPKQRDCHQLAERLHSFFTHLDTQPYIQKALSGREAQEYFLGLAHKLLNHPPVVSRETDDLYTMLKNMAHFFRVIGGKNIALIKTILSRESETIEDVIGDFHEWATGPRCEDPAFPFHPPLDKMYEYAGFFLNSLGGRSYLFRRDSRSRLLVNYYSILVVDLANDHELNRHGIDLRPLIPLAIDEIENTTQLIYKEHYLARLYQLEKKYPRPQNTLESVPILE